MPSNALDALKLNLEEIKELENANPAPIGRVSSQPSITRAIGRASVVLLSSHYERYLYAVNEELVEFLNNQEVESQKFSTSLRLFHTKNIIDDLVKQTWNNREEKLKSLAKDEIWMWVDESTGKINHNYLLTWMKAPHPKNIIRYYKYWGIENIFEAVTRKTASKTYLWIHLKTLVEKRNNIAHGDFTTEATQRDIQEYAKVVWIFCERADRKLARKTRYSFMCTSPW